MKIHRDIAEEIATDMTVGDRIDLDGRTYEYQVTQHHGETRWGNKYLHVLEHVASGDLLGLVSELGSGDADYDPFNYANEVDLLPVHTTTVVRYEV